MSGNDRSRHDRLLTSLLAGDITPDHDEVREMMAESEEFRSEWQALSRMRARLDEEDSERDEILSSLGQEPIDAVDPELAVAFRNIAAGAQPAKPGEGVEQQPRKKPGLRTWHVLAAAAMLLMAVWIPWSDLGGIFTPSDQTLGKDAKLVLLPPERKAPDKIMLSWEAPSDLYSRIAFYQIRILEKRNGKLVEIKRYSRIEATEFLVDDDLFGLVVVRVVAVDASSMKLAEGEAEFQLGAD